MKRVVIVRHGKSVPYGYEDDYNRDLRERGKNDAKIISTELKKNGVMPDSIISSPAKRAIKTARIYAENLGYSRSDIIEIEDIYDGLTTSEFLDLVQNQDDSTNTAFFFGHNPGFYYFVNNLLDSFYGDMPTCSTVGIDFNVGSWKDVEARKGKMAFHLIPKAFK